MLVVSPRRRIEMTRNRKVVLAVAVIALLAGPGVALASSGALSGPADQHAVVDEGAVDSTTTSLAEAEILSDEADRVADDDDCTDDQRGVVDDGAFGSTTTSVAESESLSDEADRVADDADCYDDQGDDADCYDDQGDDADDCTDDEAGSQS
jgi:hypothetical protein